MNYTPPPHADDMSITYVGHTPVNLPTKIGKHVYLDGGAVFKRNLFIADHTNGTVHTFTGTPLQSTKITIDEVHQR